MEKDLISIIVPVYKVEQYLDKCVQSIVEQTYENLEIILVDDGSPDNCPKMCDTWAKKDSRIKVIHKQNGGVSSARNMALDIAKGEYIGFVDSDDYIKSNMYETLISMMINNDLELSNCGYTYSLENESCKSYDEIAFMDIDEAANAMICTGEISSYLFCKLFKSEYIKELRFDTSITIAEDLIFCLEYIKRVSRIGLSQEQLYVYNQSNNNSATSNFRVSNITIVKSTIIALKLDLNYNNKAIEHLKSKAVLFAANYILRSIENKFINDDKNIAYARHVIKKYYSEIKSHEYITVKKNIIIFCAVYCPSLFVKIKKTLGK